MERRAPSAAVHAYIASWAWYFGRPVESEVTIVTSAAATLPATAEALPPPGDRIRGRETVDERAQREVAEALRKGIRCHGPIVGGRPG